MKRAGRSADFLKLNKKTLARLAKARKVPDKQFGTRWRFRRSVLEKFLGAPMELIGEANEAVVRKRERKP